MDKQKLQKANELLKKADSTEIVINAIKKLDDSQEISTQFKEALLDIRNDFIIKLIELKSEYNSEFYNI